MVVLSSGEGEGGEQVQEEEYRRAGIRVGGRAGGGAVGRSAGGREASVNDTWLGVCRPDGGWRHHELNRCCVNL